MIKAAERIVARCRQIAGYTEIAGETTRTFLSAPMREVHELLRGWMVAVGMQVRVDAAGNLRGVWSGVDGDARRLLIGSHLDSVPNAGAFDGVLGVVFGLAVVEELRGRRLPFAIEVVGFSEEEGVRFSKPFLGSMALMGRLSAELLALTDRSGVSVAEAIHAYGLNVAELPAATIAPGTFAYLEVHIEQGPVLESEAIALGVVEALVGQTRLALTFTGQANHAGTTPMHLRHDAMAAAAEWIAAVEGFATLSAGLVATVGKVETWPGAGNVIAGRVTATLDARHAQDEVRAEAVEALLGLAQDAATSRGVQVRWETTMEQSAVPMDARLTQLLEHAAARAGVTSLRTTSGAGHDAMVMAEQVPSAMLFVRSPGGLSHHPDEAVIVDDVAAAMATVMEFLPLLGDDRAERKDKHA